MIREISVTGGSCFADEPFTISDLSRFNFIYGPNGSGKTTISRALQGTSSLSTELKPDQGQHPTTRVYNCDFVENVLAESDQIPGVFFLGEVDSRAALRIEEIEKQGGERELVNKEIEANGNSIRHLEAKRDKLYKDFCTTAWFAYQTLIGENSSLKPAFTGRGGISKNKKKLADRLLEWKGTCQSTPRLDDLADRAATVYNDNAETLSRITPIRDFIEGESQSSDILASTVRARAITPLGAAIERAGSADWVAAGAKYYSQSHPHCPFCGQATSPELRDELLQLFTEDYETQRQLLVDLRDRYGAWCTSIQQALAIDAAQAPFLGETPFATAQAEFSTVLNGNRTAIQQKIENHTLTPTLTPTARLIDEINEVFSPGWCG